MAVKQVPLTADKAKTSNTSDAFGGNKVVYDLFKELDGKVEQRHDGRTAVGLRGWNQVGVCFGEKKRGSKGEAVERPSPRPSLFESGFSETEVKVKVAVSRWSEVVLWDGNRGTCGDYIYGECQRLEVT